MDLLGMVMGWNWKVQRTRRRWDRLREHALEKQGQVRKTALMQLDHCEDNLRTLAEEKLSRRDRIRMIRKVEMDMENVKDLLEKGEAWIEPAAKKRVREDIKEPQQEQ
jgi:hypothetical protein